jgi:hypothetical protein
MGERVTLSRAKGWRMPPNTVKVDRSTKWGNPYDWRDYLDAWKTEFGYGVISSDEVGREDWCRAMAVAAFREDIQDGAIVLPLHELRGLNLACWCPPHSPCHANVLLEIANPKAP